MEICVSVPLWGQVSVDMTPNLARSRLKLTVFTLINIQGWTGWRTVDVEEKFVEGKKGATENILWRVGHTITF